MDQLVTDLGSVGPMDVDKAGELAPKVNTQNKGKELVMHVRDSHPVELIKLQQRPEDLGRTKGLDPDEVLEAVTEAFGDEDEKGGVVRLLSARVRGKDRPVDDMAVLVLWETASQRTARGAIPYGPLDSSQSRYESGLRDGTIIEGLDEAGNEDAAILKRTAKRQAEQIERLTSKLEEAKGGAPAEGNKDLEGVLAAVEELKSENEQLRGQLESLAAGTHPEAEDAADGTGDGSQTAAEVEAGAEEEKVEAPEGTSRDLIAKMDDYSDAQLEAIVANDGRKSVVKAAKAKQNSRAGN